MAISEALARGKAQAESLMLDRGTMRRATGATTYNPVTQADEDEYADIGTSIAKLQARSLVARDAEVGARTATSVRLELHLPIKSPPLQRDDVWEFTRVHKDSTAFVGQRLRILAPFTKTHPTARRYEVEEVV